MVKVRGKGLGYVALQDIEPGVLLISEAPILVSSLSSWKLWVETKEQRSPPFEIISRCSFPQVVILMGGVLSSAASIDVTRQFCE